MISVDAAGNLIGDFGQGPHLAMIKGTALGDVCEDILHLLICDLDNIRCPEQLFLHVLLWLNIVARLQIIEIIQQLVSVHSGAVCRSLGRWWGCFFGHRSTRAVLSNTQQPTVLVYPYPVSPFLFDSPDMLLCE